MKQKKLGEIFEIKKGKKMDEVNSNYEQKIRYIQIEDLRGNDNVKYCKNEGKITLAKRTDILIAWDGANAGTINYGLEGAVGSTLAIIRTITNNDNIHSPYVGKYLQTKQQFLRNNCTGATIPHINKKVLQNLQIPIPPVETQKKIVQVLDKAQKLIDKRVCSKSLELS